MDQLKQRIMGTTVLNLLVMALLSFTACDKDAEADKEEPLNVVELPDISGYPVVGTKQTTFYNNSVEMSAPTSGTAFYGQNANYPGNTPNYKNNQDGTIIDMVTGLMWAQSPDTNGDGLLDYTDKVTYDEAVSGATSFNLGGYDDWRLPTIKELYSLIQFTGLDPSGYDGSSTDGLVPFIDTNFFGFMYGDEKAGERIIDSQYATSSIYVGTTMGGNTTMFGVNFADGRIKGYPAGTTPGPQGEKVYFVHYVRGNNDYGQNDFTDNGDGTITDNATGLMWMQDDNGKGIAWEAALAYAEGAAFAGYDDWRLPDVKELQSIVDYSRSPSTSQSPAIDPLFSCTAIMNEGGQTDYPFYWSGTTHANMSPFPGKNASYVSFGRALGYMFGEWMDVHGAGAQRSDPKSGSSDDYPEGHGPQGDAIRINNFLRLVRTLN